MAKTVTFSFAGRNYVFRRPIMGNTDAISFQRINRRTRGGDLIIYRDAEWPKTEVQALSFDFINDAESKQFLAFIRETLGCYIAYRDHENKLWNGFVQNPDAEVDQSGQSSFRITIQFEGDLA